MQVKFGWAIAADGPRIITMIDAERKEDEPILLAVTETLSLCGR
jgi:hypothetical protein